MEKSRVNALGLIEIVDTDTGIVLSTQKPKGKVKEALDKGEPVKRRPLSLQRMISEHWQYDAGVMDAILFRVTQGNRISKILEEPGLPPVHAFYKWLNEVPGRKAQYEECKKISAHYHAEKVIEIADDLKLKENVPVAKAKMAAHKWAAEKYDPDTYSPRQQIDSKHENVQMLIIQTGVPEPDPIDGAKNVESGTVPILEDEDA